MPVGRICHAVGAGRGTPPFAQNLGVLRLADVIPSGGRRAARVGVPRFLAGRPAGRWSRLSDYGLLPGAWSDRGEEAGLPSRAPSQFPWPGAQVSAYRSLVIIPPGRHGLRTSQAAREPW